MGFQLRFGYRFEAAHRLTHSCAAKCMTPHGHTWRADVTLCSKTDDLDEADMVVEFSRAKRLWKQLLDETFDHSMLIHVDDPLLPLLRETIDDVRVLPFPSDPTTERIAQLLFRKMEAFIDAEDLGALVDVAEVHVQETPTNSVSYAPSSAAPSTVNGYTGWWTTANPFDRDIEKV